MSDRAERDRRYNTSDKGRARNQRYNTSDKGRERSREYTRRKAGWYEPGGMMSETEMTEAFDWAEGMASFNASLAQL